MELAILRELIAAKKAADADFRTTFEFRGQNLTINSWGTATWFDEQFVTHQTNLRNFVRWLMK